jgi:crossover junction endodeoxyribonuclease RusA
MSDFVLIVEGEPVPKGRPRVVHGKAHTPLRTKAWEDTIAWKARERMMQEELAIFTEPVQVDMTFYYGNRGADLDNLVKAVWDALNGVVWQDDVQVWQMTARIYRGCAKRKRSICIRISS